MKSIIRIPLVAACLSTSIATVGCAHGEPPPFKTVPAVETHAVLDHVPGHVAVAHGGDDLPCEYVQPIARTGAKACLLFTNLERPSGVNGVVPENDRSVLVLRSEPDPADVNDASFVLVRRRCATAQRACRPEEQRIASWKAGKGGARYRKSLALSPDGRWLALLPASSFIRMNGFAPPAPDGYHFADQHDVGEMVVADLQTGVVRNTGINVLDEQPISWSSDGKRLLVVRAQTLAELTPAMRDEVRGSEGEAGKTIPVIETWNVDSGDIQMLAIGLSPVWSPDEKTLLYSSVGVAQIAYYADHGSTLLHDRSDAFLLRDLASGARSDVTLPGLIGPCGPIAFVGPRKVLYWSLPLAHTPARMTVRNSPLIGPKQMLSLMVGDLDTHEAATVVLYIDPRAQVGFSSR